MSAVELTQRPRRRCLSLLDQARISSTEANQAIVRLRVGGAYLALLGVLALFGQGDAIGAAWGPAIAYSVLAVAWEVSSLATALAWHRGCVGGGTYVASMSTSTSTSARAGN